MKRIRREKKKHYQGLLRSLTFRNQYLKKNEEPKAIFGRFTRLNNIIKNGISRLF